MQNGIILFTTIFAFAMPIGLLIYWKKRSNLSMFPFTIGGVCYLLFAMGLEQLVHVIFIGMIPPISDAILSNSWLYVLYGCIAAGLVEETGRYFGFRILLQNYPERETSVAYGIGHGGLETILTLGLTYGILLLTIRGAAFGDAEGNAALIDYINSLTVSEACLTTLERVAAMMMHIGLSIFVFTAVHQKKQAYLFPLAIVLHALAAAPLGLYQLELMSNLVLVEAIDLVIDGGILAAGIMLYRKLPVTEKKEAEQEE